MEDKTMKCNICGKDDATNYTWSEEMVCDDCVDYLDEFLQDVDNRLYDELENQNQTEV
jgi:transcription initiation factor TFIIIB Brf1 subunit/transcription initiation factor TFIIB